MLGILVYFPTLAIIFLVAFRGQSHRIFANLLGLPLGQLSEAGHSRFPQQQVAAGQHFLKECKYLDGQCVEI